MTSPEYGDAVRNEKKRRPFECVACGAHPSDGSTTERHCGEWYCSMCRPLSDDVREIRETLDGQ